MEGVAIAPIGMNGTALDGSASGGSRETPRAAGVATWAQTQVQRQAGFNQVRA